MKNTIFFIALLTAVSLFSCKSSQTTASQDAQLLQAKFEVPGSCGMCEERIENAVSVRGVKTADWSMDAQALTVVYQPSKITPSRIQELVAEAGHDTPGHKASESAYEGLAGCCKYRDGGGKCDMD